MKEFKVFAINPGSTSTKIAMFEGNEAVFSKNVSHDAEKLKEFQEISDQFEYRKETIMEELKRAGHFTTTPFCAALSGSPAVRPSVRISQASWAPSAPR